jgi:hypothetical protein
MAYRNRRSIPDALRKQILQRDSNKCQKCGRISESGQDVHHIIFVVDGGTDDPNNLITLCHACHEEWHFLARHMKQLEFRTWLDLPPLSVVLTIYTDQRDNAKLTLQEYSEMVRRNWEAIRVEGWTPEEMQEGFTDDEDDLEPETVDD